MLRHIRVLTSRTKKRRYSAGSLRAILTRSAREETGSELVEFSLCIYLWMGFVFGVIYVCMTLYAAHFVANAAQDGARYAMVRGSTWTGTTCSSSSLECAATSDDVANHIASTLAPGLSNSNFSVSTTWPGTNPAGNTCDTANGANSPNCIVQVSVTYNFNFPLPVVNLPAMTMSSTSQMTIVQ
jgi:Flp pilus assembly protein TadG